MNSERVKKRTELPLYPCTSKIFNANEEDLIKYRINSFLCLSEKEYEIFGNFYRSEMNYLEIKLWKCQNQTGSASTAPGVTPGVICKDKKTIDDYFKKESFNFAFINTMFALDNFEEPL